MIKHDYVPNEEKSTFEQDKNEYENGLLSYFSAALFCVLFSCLFFFKFANIFLGIGFAVLTVASIAMFLRTLFKLSDLTAR